MNLLLRDFEKISSSEQISDLKYPRYWSITSQIVFWNSKDVIFDSKTCPVCWEDYYEETWCDNCHYWKNNIAEFIITEEDYINFLEKEALKQDKKPREKQSNYVFLEWSDKKIRHWVSYLKNSKKILQNSWEVRLKVWKRFFNVYFDYDIETFKDHTNTDDEASKIATNLRNVRVWENWKKTNINFYDEIKGIILKEILNNSHFNMNLL